ncbi:MAG: amino acid decarboxylase [Eubacterium sp.]|nr:amino acid decarboxylase [Eubacterium sp.]
MKLHEKLKSLKRYPFHMPGHKRNPEFGITGSEIDITEIEGFDNLHDAKGVLAELEERLKKQYKSKRSFLLVNGSTVGILAAIFSVCGEGDKIIIAKNCHKSVYNACMLRRLRVVYLEPEFDSVNMCYTGIMQDRLDALIMRHGDAKAVVITSPTYEGRISNIKTDIPLIIDAAHGAHLGLGGFPSYPEGSIVVSSLHKTLPALTQTAVLNVYDEKYAALTKRYLDIFQTSSPSYVLMNSVSLCCDICLNKKLFEDYYERLCDFRQLELSKLRLKYSDDISKLVISSENTDLSGEELAKLLREKYLIEPEMASVNYVVLLTSVADTDEAFELLKTALLEIDGYAAYQPETTKKKPPVQVGESIIEYPGLCEERLLSEAVGRRAGEFVFAYPPDIPIISPNEIITEEAVSYVRLLNEYGVNTVSDSGLLPNKILTKAE